MSAENFDPSGLRTVQGDQDCLQDQPQVGSCLGTGRK